MSGLVLFRVDSFAISVVVVVVVIVVVIVVVVVVVVVAFPQNCAWWV